MEQNKDQSGEIPLCEQGNFYSLAKVRGFTDFGMTLSGKFYDEALQRFNEQYDASLAGEVVQGSAAVRGEAVTDHKTRGLLMESLGWIESSSEPAPSLCADIRKYLGLPVSARAADAPSEPSEFTALDLAELEHVAKKADPIYTDLYGDRYSQGSWSRVDLDKEQDDFIAAFKPATVLALIAAVKSRAADALDSQPTESEGLPRLPEPIEVGGEGWDFDDFKSEKTFSCEHMWAYARAAIASSQPTDGGVRNGQLMRFYDVETVEALIDAQEQHIAKLQAKLPRDTQSAFTRVREG